MPLYEYKCGNCGLEFEEIVSFEKRDTIKCKKCGCNTIMKMSVFGISTTIDIKRDTVYTPKEIDKVVGREADKKWESYDSRWSERYKKRQEKRWRGKTPEIVNIPKDSDGKYTPIMYLGTEREKKIRKEYTEALKEHRKNRIEKGLSQIEGQGALVIE